MCKDTVILISPVESLGVKCLILLSACSRLVGISGSSLDSGPRSLRPPAILPCRLDDMDATGARKTVPSLEIYSSTALLFPRYQDRVERSPRICNRYDVALFVYIFSKISSGTLKNFWTRCGARLPCSSFWYRHGRDRWRWQGQSVKSGTEWFDILRSSLSCTTRTAQSRVASQSTSERV